MNDSMSVLKKDWKEARERLTAWWQGGTLDRVPASVTAPRRAKCASSRGWISKAPEKYTDPGTVFNNLDLQIEGTFWGGEAFPSHFVYFGPMFCVSYFGGEPIFREDTTWFEPICRSVEELQTLRFDPSNRWRQAVRRMTQLSLDRSNGRYFVQNNGAIMALMDVIVGVLGVEPTLEAMIEKPEAIISARDRMMPWSRQTFDEFDSMLATRQDGGMDWMGVWAPGRVISSQCDMSAMISPEMFQDFVVPELTDIYRHLDYGIYHLDGPDEIRHVELLCGIPELDLIQWVPGTRLGEPHFGDPLNWIDLFRKIQDGGKKVLAYCPPSQVRPLLDKIAKDRVYLGINCSDETEAEGVLRELEQIGV